MVNYLILFSKKNLEEMSTIELNRELQKVEADIVKLVHRNILYLNK